VKIAYAFRRSVFYPYKGDPRGLPDRATRSRFFAKVKEIGFDGVELSAQMAGGQDASESEVREMRKELEDYGTPCVVVRGGGGVSDPRVAADSRRGLEKAIEAAHWLGATTVNATVGTPPRNPDMAGAFVGEPASQGSSRMASPEDFERTAKALREAGEVAGAYGINITVEVHQHSIADNSWSALHLLDLADSPHVFANPDLGNIYWCYDEPEETSEEAIMALAPSAKYWHCKNLHRVHIPENEHAIFIRVPLPDGEIDYRFAISAMAGAGFDGYLAIEGATMGDQLSADRRSFEYVKQLLREIE
jgi:sugar phosphate isomerase/epimerase